jgi:two-component system phosphate regulon response regulator PhoB
MSDRILVADDEEDVLKLVAMNLKSAGFLITTACDGPGALAAVRRAPPALAVLDIMMPGMSGLEVCRELKRDPAYAAIPIVILTARADEIDRILGFELGIDDYLLKPFSPRELVLRIKAILRRSPGRAESADFSQAGNIAIDRKKHSLTVAGRPVAVTPIEFKLLSVLMERPGHVLNREELVSKVWPAESDIELRTIDTHMRRLREKLGEADSIETVRGFGYRIAE